MPEEIEIKKIIDFYSQELKEFKQKIKDLIEPHSIDFYIKLYQKSGDNIRAYGSVNGHSYNAENIFLIAKKINSLIKIIKKENNYIVIDCIRNPFEALYFREKYSAFYLVALNTPDIQRKHRLVKQNLKIKEIDRLDEKEYNGKKREKDFFVSQNIQKCYDLADIHIHNPQIGKKDFSLLKRGLATYISLIMHPGLIIPSSIERCMQTAHTAKLNSGCLSRHVGAVITDENFSIKAIGWNDVPRGQTPCLLRNTEALLKHQDKYAYSEYEKNKGTFRGELKNQYNKLEDKDRDIKARNITFCFKDIQNCIDKKGNQVHTRALHAEENAFLQIVKYGGMGIKGGYLFTTSSPCELCSKKAYQLGIKKIFYIDPYPGLSNNHILLSGNNTPKLQLFCGAIGRAYHQLFEPILPYKEELELMGFLDRPPITEDEILLIMTMTIEKVKFSSIPSILDIKKEIIIKGLNWANSRHEKFNNIFMEKTKLSKIEIEDVLCTMWEQINDYLENNEE